MNYARKCSVIVIDRYTAVTAPETSDDSAAAAVAGGDLGRDLRTLEERRKSLIDHHWAVPSKDRFVEHIKIWPFALDHSH